MDRTFDTNPAPTLPLSDDGKCPKCGWRAHFVGKTVRIVNGVALNETRTCCACQCRYVARIDVK